MPKPRLFHVSEEAGITGFEPRPAPSPDSGVTGEAVWAVAESHLVNYLTPRDCPRITFGAGPATTEADRARFLFGARRVVAIEAEWLLKLQAATLHVYEMPAGTFDEALPEAGYWISRERVEPIGVEVKTDLVRALLAAGAEIRLLQDFWPLRDAVVGSSLEFSIIRTRHARPRNAGAQDG
jgi:hypothetical protein